MIHGRQEELARLATLCRQARRGHGGSLVIRGEAGIGKTALLTAAAAVADGMTALSTTGVESEIELGFAGLQAILEPLLGELDALPQAQADTVRSALGMRAGVVTDLAVCTATMQLLVRHARDRPLLITVDDAHCMDRASLTTLLFAARRLRALPIAMVLAVRDPDEHTVGTGELSELRLAGLSHADADRLLDELPWAPTGSVRAALVAATGGNPLALTEFATTPDAVETALVTGTVPLGDRLRTAFAARLRRLPPDTRRALLVAAAEDSGRAAVVGAAASRLGLSTDALLAAERAGLVESTGGRFRFRHPLVRSVTYTAAPADLRRAAHAALAQELIARGERGRAYRHRALVATDPDEELAGVLERDADELAGRGGHAAVASVLRRAALLSDDPRARRRRLVTAAYASWKSGQPAVARELVALAGHGPVDPVTHVMRIRLRGMVELYSGDQLAALAELTRGADLLAGTVPDHAADLLLMAGDAAFHAGQLAEPARLAERVAELPCDPGYARFARWATLSAVDGLAERGLTPWQVFEAAPPGITDSPAHRWVLPMAISWMGCNPLLAREFGRQACAEIQRHGMLAIWVVVLPWQAELEFRLGRYADGQALAEDGLRVANHLGQHARVPDFHALLALFAAVRGDAASCRTHAGHARRQAALVHNRFAAAQATHALGLLALAEHEYELAAELLGALDLPDSPTGHGYVARAAAADLVEACLRSGQRDRAREHTRTYAARAATGPSWTLAQLRRCQALLAEDDQADKAFRSALEVPADEAVPFEQARTTLRYGQWLRRSRRIGQARTRLRTALESFQALGATPWAEQARTELRAAGGSAQPSSQDLAGRLTVQEREVVRLAASGLTNREIGARLHLSPRTVGYHLYKIFPKLGVSTRAQLRDLML